jgi:hypothetical protein
MEHMAIFRRLDGFRWLRLTKKSGGNFKGLARDPDPLHRMLNSIKRFLPCHVDTVIFSALGDISI